MNFYFLIVWLSIYIQLNLWSKLSHINPITVDICSSFTHSTTTTSTFTSLIQPQPYPDINHIMANVLDSPSTIPRHQPHYCQCSFSLVLPPSLLPLKFTPNDMCTSPIKPLPSLEGWTPIKNTSSNHRNMATHYSHPSLLEGCEWLVPFSLDEGAGEGEQQGGLKKWEAHPVHPKNEPRSHGLFSPIPLPISPHWCSTPHLHCSTSPLMNYDLCHGLSSPFPPSLSPTPM